MKNIGVLNIFFIQSSVISCDNGMVFVIIE